MMVPSVFPTSGAQAAASAPISTPTSSAETAGTNAASNATISPWASLLSRLQSLETSNPERLKIVGAQLASGVRDAASKAPTKDEKESLTQLGDAFSKVAKTGDITALKTTHHHRAHAAKHLSGGTGALLTNLLQTVDTVLGPNANVTSEG